MSSSPQPAATTAQPENDTQRHQAALNELIEIGMDMARLLHAQARRGAEREPDPAAPPQDLTPAFDRIARAVRRTVLLARHIAAPRPAAARANARKRILRSVEDTIGHVGTNKRLDTAALHRELLDRLETPALDEEIDTRPVPEIIQDICRDLGLFDQPGYHPHQRRTPADIERLDARAKGHRVPGPPPTTAPARRPPPPTADRSAATHPATPTPPSPGSDPPPSLIALANMLLHPDPSPG